MQPDEEMQSKRGPGSPRKSEPEEPEEAYGELLKFTVAGFVGGLLSGVLLDSWGWQRSAWGSWLVRTLSGEGESILEGSYAIRQRLRGAARSMAEAYGWGKLLGMVAPWIVDAGTRAFGLDIHGVETFYVPYLYAMSDQIGANVSGMLYLKRRHATWPNALAAYLAHPVMLTSLVVVILPLFGLAFVRYGGFQPNTQTRVALETIAANLCWLPPLVGLWQARHRHQP